jgi:hypothetical protein
MTFTILKVNNSDYFYEKIKSEIKENIQNFHEVFFDKNKELLSEEPSSKDQLLIDTYQFLDIQDDSTTYFLKTTTIYQDNKYLFQMMNVSGDDIYGNKLYNEEKYKYNYLGNLLINNEHNVNGKFILFAYEINDDGTYDFCDFTKKMFTDLIIKSVFRKAIKIDLYDIEQVYMDHQFNLYDTNYKALNINIDKVSKHTFHEEYVLNFRLGIITPDTDDEEKNEILWKLTRNLDYNGDIAYVYSYFDKEKYIDNLDIKSFNLMLKNVGKDLTIEDHDKKKFIFNKFNMLRIKK